MASKVNRWTGSLEDVLSCAYGRNVLTCAFWSAPNTVSADHEDYGVGRRRSIDPEYGTRGPIETMLEAGHRVLA